MKLKQKSLLSQPATKGDLVQMEKRMGAKFVTKQDFVVLKTELKTELKQALKDMVTKDELEIKFTNFGRELDENLDKRFVKQKDDITSAIADQLKDLLGPHLDMVDSHDERIKTLEQHTTHPPIVRPTL